MHFLIDLFGAYLYPMFAQAQRHMEPEMQVCKCLNMWTVCVCVVLLAVSTSDSLSVSEAGCSVQIKVCRYFLALTLRQALSADSPVGCVSPALGDINTPLMSPFLEESGNNWWVEGGWW